MKSTANYINFADQSSDSNININSSFLNLEPDQSDSKPNLFEAADIDQTCKLDLIISKTEI
jgi:hypothetical protein